MMMIKIIKILCSHLGMFPEFDITDRSVAVQNGHEWSSSSPSLRGPRDQSQCHGLRAGSSWTSPFGGWDGQLLGLGDGKTVAWRVGGMGWGDGGMGG